MSKEIYFAGAIRGDRALAKYMQEIVAYLKSLNHIILSEHVVEKDHQAVFAKKMGKLETDILEEDIEKQDIAWVDQATHIIAEVSGASTGVGREIGHAEAREIPGRGPKKILCLYLKEKEASVSAMIRGMTKDRYPNVTIASYSNIDEAKRIIDEFLK